MLSPQHESVGSSFRGVDAVKANDAVLNQLDTVHAWIQHPRLIRSWQTAVVAANSDLFVFLRFDTLEAWHSPSDMVMTLGPCGGSERQHHAQEERQTSKC